MTIPIYFQGGTHGSFLEFFLNRHLAGVETASDTPFNTRSATHQRQYISEKVFEAQEGPYNLDQGKVIVIQARYEDLLPLLCISFLRTGDFGVDPERLHEDTWEIMDNRDYRPVRDHIKSMFFTDTDEKFDEENPNCPKRILREYFKLGFKNQESIPYIVSHATSDDVFVFPYIEFYNTSKFMIRVNMLADWLDMPKPSNMMDTLKLHSDFLSRQIYRNVKKDADRVVTDVLNNKEFDIPNLNVIQQGYVDHCIEEATGIEMPTDNNNWFTTSQEIHKHIEERKNSNWDY